MLTGLGPAAPEVSLKQPVSDLERISTTSLLGRERLTMVRREGFSVPPGPSTVAVGIELCLGW